MPVNLCIKIQFQSIYLFHCQQNNADEDNAGKVIGSTDETVIEWLRYIRINGNVYRVRYEVSNTNNYSKLKCVFNRVDLK